MRYSLAGMGGKLDASENAREAAGGEPGIPPPARREARGDAAMIGPVTEAELAAKGALEEAGAGMPQEAGVDDGSSPTNDRGLVLVAVDVVTVVALEQPSPGRPVE